MSASEKNEPIIWEEDARARVENAPPFVRPGILLVTEKRARERGHKVITSEFLSEIRNESMLRVSKVIKSFGFEELTMEAFDVAKKKMKKKARKVEVIGEIESYLEARTKKKDVIIDKFKKYLDMIPERGLPWTEEALKRIERVPKFVQKMAESSIEEEAKKRKGKVITPEVVEAALGSLCASADIPGAAPAFVKVGNEGTPCIETGTMLSWSPEAQERLKRIPLDFARRRIIKRVEKYAVENGHEQISIEVYEAGKGESEMSGLPFL